MSLKRAPAARGRPAAPAEPAQDLVGSPRLNATMHIVFTAVLASCVARLLIRHELDTRTLIALGLAVVLGTLYAVGVPLWSRVGRPVLLAWLAALLVLWALLTALAPSFGFTAIPLLFLCLRLLPVPWASAAGAFLAVAVTLSWLGLTQTPDPTLYVIPPAVAVMVVATVTELRRQNEQRRRTIADLLRTRDDLAESNRRAGVLEERERLAREIHDTVAQGLSSTGMLLQAAERSWDTEPERSRALVGRAADGVRANLDEARAFVRGRGPAALDGGSLGQALAALCESLAAETGADVRSRTEGELGDLPAEVDAALYRIAQGVLANVREHSGAEHVVVTLSRIGDRVALDVIDDGVGFDPASVGRERTGERGFGLPAARARAEELGGALSMESTPGEGAGISVTIPVDPVDSVDSVEA